MTRGSFTSRSGLAVACVVVLAVAGRAEEKGKAASAPGQAQPPAQAQVAAPAPATAATVIVTDVAKPAPIPRLLDLGAGKCIPCKMMSPILDELKKEYAGRFDVEFIDVWKDPAAGQKYGVKMIPTQIFYDATGKELFRHEGFFAKDDILAKWKDFGIAFTDAKAAAPATEKGN